MKILLLGGTSFFGKDIVRSFYEAGHDVTIFTRGNATPDDLAPHAHLKGDRNRVEDLHRAASAGPWDIVVDNIAYDGRAVESALSAFKSVRRYILMSTVSVYRYIRDKAHFPQPLLEEAVDFQFTPPEEDLTDVHWKYARGKLEAERAAISQSEVRWTILRPPVVYGPYDVTDRGFWYLLRLMKGGPLALANGGANSFRLVYSRDVAKATVAAAERDQAIDRIYNITQGEILTLRNFIEDSAIALGVPANLVNTPLELLGELAGPYATMVNLVPDINAAVHDLGYKPTPWSEWAASTAQWFREHWKGDEAKLLESRPRELAFLEKWEKMLESWKR